MLIVALWASSAAAVAADPTDPVRLYLATPGGPLLTERRPTVTIYSGGFDAVGLKPVAALRGGVALAPLGGGSVLIADEITFGGRRISRYRHRLRSLDVFAETVHPISAAYGPEHRHDLGRILLADPSRNRLFVLSERMVGNDGEAFVEVFDLTTGGTVAQHAIEGPSAFRRARLLATTRDIWLTVQSDGAVTATRLYRWNEKTFSPVPVEIPIGTFVAFALAIPEGTVFASPNGLYITLDLDGKLKVGGRILPDPPGEMVVRNLLWSEKGSIEALIGSGQTYIESVDSYVLAVDGSLARDAASRPLRASAVLALPSGRVVVIGSDDAIALTMLRLPGPLLAAAQLNPAWIDLVASEP